MRKQTCIVFIIMAAVILCACHPVISHEDSAADSMDPSAVPDTVTVYYVDNPLVPVLEK